MTGFLVALRQRRQIPRTHFGQDLNTEKHSHDPRKRPGGSNTGRSGGGHLLVGVQHGQQQVVWAELSALLLQREARQQAALLVVALGGLLAQPLHGERIGLAGTQWRRRRKEKSGREQNDIVR